MAEINGDDIICGGGAILIVTLLLITFLTAKDPNTRVASLVCLAPFALIALVFLIIHLLPRK